MDQKSEEGRLNQPQSDQSQREFEAWLLKNTDGTKADELLFDVLEDCKTNSGGERWQAAFAQFKTNIGFQPKVERQFALHNILLWSQRVAAILFIPLLLMGGYLFYSRSKPVVWDELFVPYGETRQLVLCDGTTLRLNGGTKLIYPDRFTGLKRQIFVSGEAFADVAKNPDQPFVMSFGVGQVEVLGTRFNVKSYGEDEEVEVALFEGSVMFCTNHDADPGRQIVLEPGEMVRYNKLNHERSVVGHHRDESVTWFEGNNFYFTDKPLEDICRDLTRRFRCAFVFEDAEVAALRYYAVFQNNESLEEILEVLNVRNDLDIKLKGSTYFISGRGGPGKNIY
ncbi:MAG: FecR family protein [Breznakibacter sp.]